MLFLKQLRVAAIVRQSSARVMFAPSSPTPRHCSVGNGPPCVYFELPCLRGAYRERWPRAGRSRESRGEGRGAQPPSCRAMTLRGGVLGAPPHCGCPLCWQGPWCGHHGGRR